MGKTVVPSKRADASAQGAGRAIIGRAPPVTGSEARTLADWRVGAVEVDLFISLVLIISINAFV